MHAQRIILQSNEDVVIIDGKEYSVAYIKVASNSYEYAKERARRYKKNTKMKSKEKAE